jgi:hypothetical protein
MGCGLVEKSINETEKTRKTEKDLLSTAQVRRNVIRNRKSEIDVNTMKAKITQAAKWSNFKIMREKVIDKFIKAKRL